MTPAERNAIIEECAKLIESHAVDLNANGWPKKLLKLTEEFIGKDAVAATYAAAIRALKESAAPQAGREVHSEAGSEHAYGACRAAPTLQEYKSWWERDSKALGQCLQEIHTLRAIKEDQRARIASLERELNEANLRAGLHKNAADGLAQMVHAIQLEPTKEMIEAGAQRLVRWETGEEKWPEAWRKRDVRAARNDAERCWRSMWLAATEGK